MNKLPEVGKRYINALGEEHEVEKIREHTELQSPVVEFKKTHPISMHLGDFFNYYKELPDQEPTNHIDQVDEKNGDKVQEGLKELKAKLSNVRYVNFLRSDLRHLVIAVQDLINVLEDSQIEPSLRDKPISQSDVESKENNDTCITESTSESIWKPISELPSSYLGEVYLKNEDYSAAIKDPERGLYDIKADASGGLYSLPTIVSTETKFCTLPDFINHQENLEKRIKKLESENARK